jgi:catechol 2,3-dioxygenase-like lactoylglutathione lyase family enzyme
MKQVALTIILLFAGSTACAQENAVPRPPILAISHVRFHVTQPEAAVHFYQDVLGLTPGPNKNACENTHLRCFWVSQEQFVQLDLVEQRRPSISLLEELAFVTPDLEAMRKFLASRGVKGEIVMQVQGLQHDLEVKRSGRLVSFSVLDPEGNRIVFEERQNGGLAANDRSVSPHLIHTGFVIHDRAAADHFYKDILGFRLYWHGGRTDNETNWVAMQVPDGSDWLEYMLGASPNASHKTLGVMNHISLGVPDIHAARQQVIKNGWKPTEEPKIGRDGKWQLNVYDPDETRVEFMEFKPSKEPCCSPFTGPHPGPQQ